MTGKIAWTDEQIQQIREERFLQGFRRRDLCLKWHMSEGHLDRVLAGTSRPEAGGPILGGRVLPVMRAEPRGEISEAEIKASEARLDRLLAQKAQRNDLGHLSEKAFSDYGARRPEDLMVGGSGVPLPPDWKDFVVEEEKVVKPSDVDQMLDELEKVK